MIIGLISGFAKTLKNTDQYGIKIFIGTIIGTFIGTVFGIVISIIYNNLESKT